MMTPSTKPRELPVSDSDRARAFKGIVETLRPDDSDDFARIGIERAPGDAWTPRQTLLSPTEDRGFLAVTYYIKSGEIGHMRSQLRFSAEGQLVPSGCRADQALTMRWDQSQLTADVDRNLFAGGHLGVDLKG